MEHYATAPQDRIPFPQKLIYGLGAFVNNLLAAAIGGMVIVLNLGLGMNPALVGLVSAIPRLTDAFTDPLVGFISDNTRSRWGRRRPYIFVGAIAVGIVFAILWQLPPGKSESFYFWYFLVGSFIFYLAYTVFATPWVALGYELTPDYHERTRLMGVQNFIGQMPYLIAPWFLWIMQNEAWFGDMRQGAGGLAIGIAVIAVAVGVLPALFLRERFVDVATAESKAHAAGAVLGNVARFLHGFAITLKFKPFLKLCVATFLVFNGFMMIASFQSYVIIYYVFGGDTSSGSEYVGYAGTLQSAMTFLVIILATWVGTRIGKRRTLFLAIGVSMLGYALKWVCYNPAVPWLLLIPSPLLAFGLGGLFTIMPSMIADVVDADELNTHERREGMYGSIFWWVVKLGMAAALAAGGFLLNATGFDVELGSEQSERTILLLRIFDVFIPFVASGIEIRKELEARRGAA
jgi:GPH family glycoside/pentoside/hexuronide:cation symporter